MYGCLGKRRGDRGPADVVHDRLCSLDVGAADMAHATLGKLLVWRHLNLGSHRRHLILHLRRRSGVTVLLHLHARHARGGSRTLRYLPGHGVLVKGIELTRRSRSGHRSSLRRRDAVALGHGRWDTIALRKVHLLVNSSGSILCLLIMRLRRNDGRGLVG